MPEIIAEQAGKASCSYCLKGWAGYPSGLNGIRGGSPDGIRPVIASHL